MDNDKNQNLEATLLNDFEMIYKLFTSGKISLRLLVNLMKERTNL